MKNTRKLIPAIAMLLVSAVMLSTASFAWFTMSTEAAATGMQVKATASSSLLITTENVLATWLSADGDVAFDDDAQSLVPATHDDTFANGLKTLSSTATGDVTSATGAYTGTDFVDSTASNFVDYTVYIGTAGAAMEGQTLTAEVTIEDDIVYLLHNAVTVDFLVDGAYLSSINLEEVRLGGNKAAKVIAEDLDIPMAVNVDENGDSTLGSCVTVVMRVYFDGALPDSTTSAEGDCYVRNAMATTNAIGFSVNFSVQ